MAFTLYTACLPLLVSLCYVITAPVHSGQDGAESKSDVPVQQLENLKQAELSNIGGEHVDYHRLDAVESNGKLISQLVEHGSSDAVGGEKPRVHAEAQLDVPGENVHKVLIQDGGHVSVHDVTVPTTMPSEEATPKVFHGAARLVQPGSSTNGNPASTHTAIRRASDADMPKATKNHLNHRGAYAGPQYTPFEMAEYVFLTGDERGIADAIEGYIQDGMLTKEEAIDFLQETKFNIDYLLVKYSQNLKAAEEQLNEEQQEKLRNSLIEQANAKEYQYRGLDLQSFPYGGSLSNLSPLSSLPISNELRPEPVKRMGALEPLIQSNLIGTDYDREGQMITEEEYEELIDKLKAADSLYTEYTLEVIYQLAKMMFSQTLSRDPAATRIASQRFITFLEFEIERGHLTRSIGKKVLDLMIAALTDTIGEHPELLHETSGIIPANRLMRQLYEFNQPDTSISRAILAAYKDELFNGSQQRIFASPE